MDFAAVELGRKPLAPPERVDLVEASAQRQRRVQRRSRQEVFVEEGDERSLEDVARHADRRLRSADAAEERRAAVARVAAEERVERNPVGDPRHLHLVQRMLHLTAIAQGGDIQRGPERRSHRNPLHLPHFVRPQDGPMAPEPVLRAEGSRPSHFDRDPTPPAQPQSFRGGPVTEDSPRPTGEHSCMPPSLARRSAGARPRRPRGRAAAGSRAQSSPSTSSTVSPRRSSCRRATTPCCAAPAAASKRPTGAFV